MRCHEVVDLFPPMIPSEREALQKDIELKGVRMPIVTWRGKVIDGRNRLAVCEDLGIDDFPVEEFDGSEEEMLAHVVSLNMSRRQLNSGQKAVVGVDLGVYRERLGDVELSGGQRTIELIASELGTNRQYMYDAEKLREKDKDLYEQVRRGEIKLTAAMKALDKLDQAHDVEDDVEKLEPSQKQKADEVVDGKGDPVPPKFHDAFKEVSNYKYALEQIKELSKTVEGIAVREEGSAYLDVSNIAGHLNSLMQVLKSSMPYAICPYCEGKGQGCDACKDVGYVTKTIWDYAPEEMK